MKRVARSSTSAEAQMCANALDFHEFSKLGWIDLQEPTKVDLRVADEYLRTFESGLIVDARNIYDGLSRVESSGLQMEEKRTAIGLLAIKERLHQAAVDLKWVDGEQEHADGLTKSGCHEPLLKALYQSTRISCLLERKGLRDTNFVLMNIGCTVYGQWTQEQHKIVTDAEMKAEKSHLALGQCILRTNREVYLWHRLSQAQQTRPSVGSAAHRSVQKRASIGGAPACLSPG